MAAFEELMGFVRQTTALGQVAGRLGWDQETMMPKGAVEQRAQEMEAMESVLHARHTDPKVAQWLSEINDQDLDLHGKAQIREIRRSFARANKVPADLASEIAMTNSKSQHAWAQARANDDFAAFAPTLERVIDLKRQEAQALAEGGDLYDALIDDYEPNMKADEFSALFDEMRPVLSDLRAQVREAKAPDELDFRFDAEQQLVLSRKVAQSFGYDESRGRIDLAVHPFCSGAGNDVRITTRTNEKDPFNCIYSTIHEVGHATYEQNINPAYLLTPLGRGVSMGVHESQSRIYENQIGRGRAYTEYLYKEMRDAFGDFGIDGPEAFYRCVNRVNAGYIRTEADEMQYNLHVMLRFDLERALILGDLSVGDLEAAWNDRFKADFGYDVDKPSNGVLQDVHWSCGLFGYFPTYSLGNIYAGCLNASMRQELPDLDAEFSQGDTRSAMTWLRENLQYHGGLYAPQEVIEKACKTKATAAPLLDYLKDKFTQIYDL